MSQVLRDRVASVIARREAAGTLTPGAGIAVAVVRGQDVLAQATLGLRERDRELPVTPSTRFEIGSLTKAFTATALLLAQDEGRLDLERPLNDGRTLLPLKDPAVTRELTLTDVLAHRTGLPGHDLLWYFGPSDPETLTRAIGGLELVPGAFRREHLYNNLLYGALGRLFEPLLGERWEDVLRRRLWAPLGMTATSAQAPSEEVDRALGYAGSRRAPRVDMSAVAAAGALSASLEDLTRWLGFHLSGGLTPDGSRLLASASIARQQARAIEIATPNPLHMHGLEWLSVSGYGLGWYLGETRGKKAVFHPGLLDGFSSALVLLPEERLGFVALTNLNLSDAPGLIIEDLVGALLDAPAPPPAAPRTPLGDALVGEYRHPTWGALSVRSTDGRLALVYHGHAWPLTIKDDQHAEALVTAFGLPMPLPVLVEARDGRAVSLALPLSLDSRLPAYVFARVSG